MILLAQKVILVRTESGESISFYREIYRRVLNSTAKDLLSLVHLILQSFSPRP